ncbi:MAG: helix-turn-helix domain-containing protein [Roseococcus sp.]|nr:helix-turn-helix domain-containing protein [Roseococcus sp.]
MALRRKDGSWQGTRLPNGDWHPEEIKAAVRMSKRGMSLFKLARTKGIHPHACTHATSRPHYEGELAIAELLGLSPADIWPSRHEADGTRICVIRSRSKLTADAPDRHCEKQVAA